jgi:hypothetical protein
MHVLCWPLLLQGCVLEEYSAGVEEKLRSLELESIQDYIAESDNLADLHQQVSLVMWDREQHQHHERVSLICACSQPTPASAVHAEAGRGSSSTRKT